MKVLLIVLGAFLCWTHSVTAQCFDAAAAAQSTSNDLYATTDFALTLFKELFSYKNSENFFFSPYSIWSALALAHVGSDGHTELQLKRALGVESKIETLKKLRSVELEYKKHQADSSGNIFKVANRAYFDNSVRLTSCVQTTLSNELRVVDMSKASEVSVEINEWVSNTTKGRITELVHPRDLENANMVLTNAAFFKGTWLSQFKKSSTKKEIFYSSPDQFAFVDMMEQKGNFRLGNSEELGAQILELPYTGEDVSMLLLLPPFITGDQGFDAMVERLNATTLRYALDALFRNEVEVKLPKFTLEESVGDELMFALSRMGIKDLFDPLQANLSGFTLDGGLSVTRSIHKALVEVSEEGTEAAAATALISLRFSRVDVPDEFHCNHPFLFIIYDNVNNTVLFMGAYKSPTN